MTQSQVIALLVFCILIEVLCMRHFWLRSEKAEEEAKQLRAENDRMREYMKPFTIRDMDRFREIMQAEKDGRLIIADFKDWHPCRGCYVGWGSANANGVINTCEETCERFAEWVRTQKKEG